MATAPNEKRQLAHTRAASVQTYAKIAGILFLLSLVAGGFGEAYVPSRLMVSSDATATAQNIKACVTHPCHASTSPMLSGGRSNNI